MKDNPSKHDRGDRQRISLRKNYCKVLQIILLKHIIEKIKFKQIFKSNPSVLSITKVNKINFLIFISSIL